LEMTQTRYNDLKVALYERIKEKGLVDIGAATPPPVTSPIPHIMHLPRRFALCCLFSFGALGLVRATPPDFGPNVMIFDPSMPTSQIQTAVDAIANQQISNQFGTQRYALLFMPGTYGSADTPLNFQVGYYTTVAGLGFSPNDVVINGSIDVYNQCAGPNNCVALTNFWRSLSNLTINVTTPNFGCKTGEFWAVSQAAPMRRVHVNGLVTLMDYCTNPSYASGGFIADSEFDGSTVINGSQQQWLVRNSKLDGWTNAVWNQVFSGVGAPLPNRSASRRIPRCRRAQ
jgi:Pectate lyase superfamily protein